MLLKSLNIFDGAIMFILRTKDAYSFKNLKNTNWRRDKDFPWIVRKVYIFQKFSNHFFSTIKQYFCTDFFCTIGNRHLDSIASRQ